MLLIGARKVRGRLDVRIRVIGFGLQILIAAMFCALLTVPATAHPGHVHDTSARVAATALDALIVQASSGDFDQEEQVIAVAAHPLASSCCCCGQNGCCTGSGCNSGTACSSASCGHGGNALVLSHAVRVDPPAEGAAAAHSDQLVAGKTLGPEDRPPRF